MSQIIIASHWHTGSTILAKMLNACGMEVGNENTYWTEDCVEQCEHSLLNWIGDCILLSKEVGYDTCADWDTENELERKARDILFSYIEESHKLGWEHYGIKATHILQDECWKFFKPIFNAVWPDAQYIISIRHPLHIYLSTGDSAWPIERVIESFMSTVDAIKDIAINSVGAFIIEYPFSVSSIQDIVCDIELDWDIQTYTTLFDMERASKGSVDIDFFDECYPEVAKAYKELQSYVNV